MWTINIGDKVRFTCYGVTMTGKVTNNSIITLTIKDEQGKEYTRFTNDCKDITVLV